MNNIKIRPMEETDWEAVKAIYLQGISEKNATFQTSVSTWEEWDKSHLSICRFVVEIDDAVLGWAMLSPISNRCVYSGVAEVSVYVAKEARGKGLGGVLLTQLIQDSEANGLWTLEANTFPENTASIGLHKRCGFREVGRREKLGKLEGQWRDVILLERRSLKVM